jgi:hypothetical protein
VCETHTHALKGKRDKYRLRLTGVQPHMHKHVHAIRTHICIFLSELAHECLRSCVPVCVCVCVCVPRRGPAVFRTAIDARAAHVCLRVVPSVGSRAWPQASHGRVVRPARRGLGDMVTRPWSTLPAPSTSSAAAAAAPPTSTMCGSAPAEVRTGLAWGTRAGTRGSTTRGCYRGSGHSSVLVGYTGAPDGHQWVLIGYSSVLEGHEGLHRGCSRGTKGFLGGTRGKLKGSSWGPHGVHMESRATVGTDLRDIACTQESM